jgi:hypothetical protein
MKHHDLPTLGEAITRAPEEWRIYFIEQGRLLHRLKNTRDEAMDEASNLLRRHGCSVSYVTGPNGVRIELTEIRRWRQRADNKNPDHVGGRG